MITKLVSSKSVIAKIIADLDLQESDMRITDMREWIAEAIEKIGATTQLQHKVKDVPYCNHQAPLPCDIYQLDQVAYSPNKGSTWLPMRYATGSFSVWGEDTDINCDCVVDEVPAPTEAVINLTKDMYNLYSDKEAIELLNSNDTIRKTVNALYKACSNSKVQGYGGITTVNPSIELQYSTKPGYIMCNVPAGLLKLSYYAVPTDTDGYPLIPDKPSYSEAIYWYVSWKLCYPKKLTGQMNRQDVDAMHLAWNYYCKQAYGDALMPNSDGMQAIKNQWLKMIPEIDDHDNFYSNTGDRQYIYNQNF